MWRRGLLSLLMVALLVGGASFAHGNDEVGEGRSAGEPVAGSATAVTTSLAPATTVAPTTTTVPTTTSLPASSTSSSVVEPATMTLTPEDLNGYLMVCGLPLATASVVVRIDDELMAVLEAAFDGQPDGLCDYLQRLLGGADLVPPTSSTTLPTSTTVPPTSTTTSSTSTTTTSTSSSIPSTSSTAPPTIGRPPGGGGGGGNNPLADKPVLIALGDSISSGHHHQLQDGQVKLICDAPDYSYAAEVYRRLAARPGRIWADPGQYHNLAHSGSGTSKAFWPKGTVAGGVLDGGTTACMKETAFDAPIVQAVALLKARADKDVRGNKVVITAGINDTNWTQVLRNARMVASTGLDHSKTELQQDLPGWPHPNPDGHNRIATEIVELLPS